MRLFYSACFLAVSLCVLLSFAIPQGFAALKQVRHQTELSVSAHRHAVAVEQQLAELHPQPAFAVRGLMRHQVFEDSGPFSPTDVFQLIAELLSDHPDVVLDALQWAPVQQSQDVDVVSVNPDTVPSREYWWSDADVQTSQSVQVTLFGRITSNGFRRRQDTFDRLLDSIRDNTRVTRSVIHESPLSQRTVRWSDDQAAQLFGVSFWVQG